MILRSFLTCGIISIKLDGSEKNLNNICGMESYKPIPKSESQFHQENKDDGDREGSDESRYE